MLARRATVLATLLLGSAAAPAAGQAPARRPLAAADIDDIAKLEMLEDQRRFEADELTRLLGASHPEVRRRAALAVARLNDKRGITLLRARPLDGDTAVAATVVFAVGQLRDSLTVPWFDSLLSDSRTPQTLAKEAAIALGKIKTAGARAVLARFLSTAAESPRTTPAIQEALLSIGRSTARGDVAPIVKWTTASSEELRWRATWSLFRARDPVSIRTLLTMSKDPSGLVRSWAVRGLTRPQVDSARLVETAEAQLLAAARDADRRVRTEALRGLATFTDSAAVAALIAGLASSDSWISVTATEGLARLRSDAAAPALVAATGSSRPCTLRLAAMTALQAYQPENALAAAARIARDSVPYCRVTAYQTLQTAVSGGRGRGGAAATTPRVAIEALLDTLRRERRKELASTDVTARLAAIRAMAGWADSTDLPALRALQQKAQSDSSPIAAAAASTIASIQNRMSGQTGGGAGGRGGGGGRGNTPASARTLADYRAIVVRWVVPDYNGAPRPTARWVMPRGTIDLELYPGDAPLAVDDFVRTMRSGAIVGTEFSRVVADFVDQQRTIRNGNTLRDEVNRNGLTRANLAWATAGLDTGSPGYTLNHTPQPHNEGDFTSMGRVIAGMDVVDRIELGDRILSARMLTVPGGNP